MKAAAVKAPVKKAPVTKTPVAKVAPRGPAAKAAKPAAATPAASRDEWKPGELAEVRAALARDAEELQHEFDEATQAIDDVRTAGADSTGDDQADKGSATFEREQGMSLAANSRDMLTQTQRALQRIDDGTYGACENCGKPIGKDRLQAFPRATLCKECKQREERR